VRHRDFWIAETRKEIAEEIEADRRCGLSMHDSFDRGQARGYERSLKIVRGEE